MTMWRAGVRIDFASAMASRAPCAPGAWADHGHHRHRRWQPVAECGGLAGPYVPISAPDVRAGQQVLVDRGGQPIRLLKLFRDRRRCGWPRPATRRSSSPWSCRRPVMPTTVGETRRTVSVALSMYCWPSRSSIGRSMASAASSRTGTASTSSSSPGSPTARAIAPTGGHQHQCRDQPQSRGPHQRAAPAAQPQAHGAIIASRDQSTYTSSTPSARWRPARPRP